VVQTIGAIGALAGVMVLEGLMVTVGAPISILAGIYSIQEAHAYGDRVAHLQGYVLALADMAEGRNPNSRRIDTTWFNRGRADAIRFIREKGRQEGILFLLGLRRDYPSPQARVNFLWQEAIRSLPSRERTLAEFCTPGF
jgi:hypothetical protein